MKQEKGKISLTFLILLAIIGVGIYLLVLTAPAYIRWVEIKGVVETNLKRSFTTYEEFENTVISKWKEMEVDLTRITLSHLEGDEIYLSYTHPVVYFGRYTHVFQFEMRAEVKYGEE